MIPSLSNLRFPQILRDDHNFLEQIRLQILKRMKRKLYASRVHEYSLNENYTSHLRNHLHPNLFEQLLRICNLEFTRQTTMMNNTHRHKLLRLSNIHNQSEQIPPDTPPMSSLHRLFQSSTKAPNSFLLYEKLMSLSCYDLMLVFRGYVTKSVGTRIF